MYSHMSADEDLLEITSIIGREADEVKRAHRAADRLQLDLLNGALTERFSLGTAREIRERYGLGRWACREAIGILELRGVATIRAGRGGGLVATVPSFGNLAKLMLLHLYMKRAYTRELIEARRLVHLAALRRVVERGGEPEELVEMRRVLAVPQQKVRDAPAPRLSFSGWLADRTGNGAFRFAVDFVETLCDSYVVHAEAPAVEAPRRGVRREEEAL
jgi:DNA-binding FadR family transcriptional regulator